MATQSTWVLMSVDRYNSSGGKSVVQLATQASPWTSQCCALLLYVMSRQFITLFNFTLAKSHARRVKVRDSCTESLAARGNPSPISKSLSAQQVTYIAQIRTFPTCKQGRGASCHNRAPPTRGLRSTLCSLSEEIPPAPRRYPRCCWRPGHRYSAGRARL